MGQISPYTSRMDGKLIRNPPAPHESAIRKLQGVAFETVFHQANTDSRVIFELFKAPLTLRTVV